MTSVANAPSLSSSMSTEYSYSYSDESLSDSQDIPKPTPPPQNGEPLTGRVKKVDRKRIKATHLKDSDVPGSVSNVIVTVNSPQNALTRSEIQKLSYCKRLNAGDKFSYGCLVAISASMWMGFFIRLAQGNNLKDTSTLLFLIIGAASPLSCIPTFMLSKMRMFAEDAG